MKKIIPFLALLLIQQLATAQNTACNWAFAPSGSNTFNGLVYNTAVDHQGNILQCGTIYGIADMDPGSGPADTSFSFPTYNYYLSKTDITGHLIWIKYFTSVSPIPTFIIHGMDINSQDEIIITGDYFGAVDMDLSPTGTFTITSHQPTYNDFFVAKYNTNGELQWANTFGGTSGNIGASSLDIQNNDRIVLSISTGSNLDLDPGTGTALAVGGSANIVCYDTDGNYIWSNQISKPTSYSVDNKSIDCDSVGNSYLLSVGYYELTVTKFDLNGLEIWCKTIGDFQNLARVEPHSLYVDKDGSFYIVGKYLNVVDFDPGVGVNTQTSSSQNDHDGFFVSYDADMLPLWVKTYTGRITFGNQSLVKSGSDFITGGQLMGNVIMGPGVTYSASTYSPFFIRTDGSGNLVAGGTFQCAGKVNTIDLSPTGHLISTGIFSGTVDIDPTVSGTVTLTSGSSTTSFTAVYASPFSGILESNIHDIIQVYPNPTHGCIRFQNQAGRSGIISVFDSNGRRCIEKEFGDDLTVTIPANHLSSGVYNYRICGKSKELISSGKIVIE